MHGNKSLIAIVVLALLALALFGVAAQMLSESSPKVRAKVEVERGVPGARVVAIETSHDPKSERVTQRLRLEPTGASLTAEDLEAAIVLAYRALTAPDLSIRLPVDALEASAPGLSAGPWDPVEVQERERLGTALRLALPELQREWGLSAPPRVRIAGGRGRYVALLEARPPGARKDDEIAAPLFRRIGALSFVEVPSADPAAPPARVPRPRR
jgi:hypothetical protein